MLSHSHCTGKSEALYKAILVRIREKASAVAGVGPLLLKKCHVDFEAGLRNAFIEVIGGWIIGCNFHYIQVRCIALFFYPALLLINIMFRLSLIGLSAFVISKLHIQQFLWSRNLLSFCTRSHFLMPQLSRMVTT